MIPSQPYTLKSYIDTLNHFLKEYPEAKNLPIYTAIDDEWNGYNPVYFWPELGYLDPEDNQLFVWLSEFKDPFWADEWKDFVLNSVILN